MPNFSRACSLRRKSASSLISNRGIVTITSSSGSAARHEGRSFVIPLSHLGEVGTAIGEQSRDEAELLPGVGHFEDLESLRCGVAESGGLRHHHRVRCRTLGSDEEGAFAGVRLIERLVPLAAVEVDRSRVRQHQARHGGDDAWRKQVGDPSARLLLRPVVDRAACRLASADVVHLAEACRVVVAGQREEVFAKGAALLSPEGVRRRQLYILTGTPADALHERGRRGMKLGLIREVEDAGHLVEGGAASARGGHGEGARDGVRARRRGRQVTGSEADQRRGRGRIRPFEALGEGVLALVGRGQAPFLEVQRHRLHRLVPWSRCGIPPGKGNPHIRSTGRPGGIEGSEHGRSSEGRIAELRPAHGYTRPSPGSRQTERRLPQFPDLAPAPASS